MMIAKSISTQELETLLKYKLPRTLRREIRLELYRRRKPKEEKLKLDYDVIKTYNDVVEVVTSTGKILMIPLNELIEGYDFLINI